MFNIKISVYPHFNQTLSFECLIDGEFICINLWLGKRGQLIITSAQIRNATTGTDPQTELNAYA